MKTRDYNELIDQNEEVRQELEDLKTNPDLRISELESELSELQMENATLREEASQEKVSGYGKLEGSIAPVVLEDGKFAKYQLVCAQSSRDSGRRFCTTASTISKKYEMLVPIGSYNIYAYNLDSNGAVIAEGRGVYSVIINCLQNKPAEDCTETPEPKPVVVDLKEGETKSDLDPIDWTE